MMLTRSAAKAKAVATAHCQASSVVALSKRQSSAIETTMVSSADATARNQGRSVVRLPKTHSAALDRYISLLETKTMARKETKRTRPTMTIQKKEQVSCTPCQASAAAALEIETTMVSTSSRKQKRSVQVARLSKERSVAVDRYIRLLETKALARRATEQKRLTMTIQKEEQENSVETPPQNAGLQVPEKCDLDTEASSINKVARSKEVNKHNDGNADHISSWLKKNLPHDKIFVYTMLYCIFYMLNYNCKLK